MNNVRDRDSANRCFADHTNNLGNEQMYRPKKSPRPNTRKWIEVKSRG